MTATRTARYDKLSAFLASCSDFELVELMGTGRVTSVGVGGESGIVAVDGVPVFTKRIPLSDREVANQGSTANLFDLPVYCQYGMGGPGFNAWRELAANVVVTNAVLAGETQSFPVLHHWRVLPGRSPIAAEHADIDSVVAAQDGHPAVRTVWKRWLPQRAVSCCSASTSRTRWRIGCETTRPVRPSRSNGSFRRS